jgi:hypothetical protein
MGFKDLMVVKTRQPGFFFEYKKNRTELLKVTVPPTKERFYKKFIREQQEQKDKELETCRGDGQRNDEAQRVPHWLQLTCSVNRQILHPDPAAAHSFE